VPIFLRSFIDHCRCAAELNRVVAYAKRKKNAMDTRSTRRACSKEWENSIMAYVMPALKRKRRRKAVPASEIAGGSLSQMDATSRRHEIALSEEEISDVSLATFYVFDKENVATRARGEKLSRWANGCGGCGGCGCGEGCGGGGGCSGRSCQH
jgi:hypothetical protein